MKRKQIRFVMVCHVLRFNKFIKLMDMGNVLKKTTIRHKNELSFGCDLLTWKEFGELKLTMA